MSEHLLKTKEVCDRIGFGITVVTDWVAEGKFPQPIRPFGKCHPLFVESEVDAWIDEQIRLNREVA